MEKKRIILIITVIVLISVFSIYQFFLKKEKPAFALEKISKGQILQEVSETGVVKVSEEINLGFESTGKIEKVYVKVGDKVEPGKSLAKLETSQLFIQLSEAKASLQLAQAKLEQLLAGASEEEIKSSETSVLNAQNDLRADLQNLEDVKADAEEDLNAAYEDALNVLDDAYLKAYNSSNTVDLVQRTYFTGSDQEGLIVQEKKNTIKTNLSQAKNYLDIAKANPENENIDKALVEFKTFLNNIYNSLTIIRDIIETTLYRNTVSSADKTSLDTHRTNIQTVLTNIINAQQTISSTKITNKTNINTAQAKVSSAEGDLKKAEDNLLLVKAEPRQVDIDVYQAQVNEAQAKVYLLENQIQKATLKSPVKGQISKIDKKTGETIQTGESVISLISLSPFQIESDIYEEDIIKVKVGNPVDIIIVAFPDETLKGNVVSINPAEKLIEGVVYYETTIDFGEKKEGIKKGMTVDIVIKTDFRENVLIISESAIQKKNGKFTVQVFKNGQIEEREIKIGLRGSDGMIEVISGLQENEEVVVE